MYSKTNFPISKALYALAALAAAYLSLRFLLPWTAPLLLAFAGGRVPFDLAAYSFVYVAVVLSPTWLLSGPRYLYALCVLPMLLARMRIGKAGHTVLLAVSAGLLVLWTFGYTIAVQVL